MEIAASMITVILVYLTYQNLNLLLNQMLELPVETVLIPGEPLALQHCICCSIRSFRNWLQSCGTAKRKKRQKSEMRRAI